MQRLQILLYRVYLFGFLLAASACTKNSSGTREPETGNPAIPQNPPITSPSAGWYVDSTGFNATGTFITLVGVQSNNKIVVANKTGIGRLNTDGSKDATFKSRDLATGNILTLFIDKNDRILIGGTFTDLEGYSYLARLTTTGEIDKTFYLPDLIRIGNTETKVNAIGGQSDGRLIIGGTFAYMNTRGGVYMDVARLSQDGAIDLSFTYPGGETMIRSISLEREVTDIAVLPDDKIYLTGKTLELSINGNDVRNTILINSNGTIDPIFVKGNRYFSFNSSSGFAQTIAPLSDGSVIVGGTFTGVQGTTVMGYLHQLPDGTPDFGYTDAGRASVNDIAVFSDDEIFLANISNANSKLFGAPMGRLELIGKNGKKRNDYHSTFPREGGDVFAVVKESDSTVLIAGQLLVEQRNGSLIYKGIARIKKAK